MVVVAWKLPTLFHVAACAQLYTVGMARVVFGVSFRNWIDWSVGIRILKGILFQEVELAASVLETDGMLCHYQILCGSAIVLRGFHKFKGFNEVSFESVLYSHLPSTVSKKTIGRRGWLKLYCCWSLFLDPLWHLTSLSRSFIFYKIRSDMIILWNVFSAFYMVQWLSFQWIMDPMIHQ